MKKFWYKGASMLLMACLSVAMVGFSGCHDDDEEYVAPPTVTVAPHVMSGVILDNEGAPVVGATVAMDGKSVQTNEKGLYEMKDVKSGTFVASASAEGKLTHEAEVVIAESKKTLNVVWNTVLVNEVKTEVAVSATVDTKADVTSETLKGNEKAQVKVDAAIPAGAVESASEEVSVVIAPIYNAFQKGTKATTAMTMLMGSSVTCSDKDAKLVKPVELTFNVDPEVMAAVHVRKLENGAWVDVARAKADDGVLKVEASDFGSFGLFLDVDFSLSEPKMEPISFDLGNTDNMYGSSSVHVADINYNYIVGTVLEMGNTMMEGLLVEKLAQVYGSNAVESNGFYPANVTLPVGSKLVMSGKQEVSTISASAGDVTVSAIRYGDVTVSVTSTSRSHTGGSN